LRLKLFCDALPLSMVDISTSAPESVRSREVAVAYAMEMVVKLRRWRAAAAPDTHRERAVLTEIELWRCDPVAGVSRAWCSHRGRGGVTSGRSALSHLVASLFLTENVGVVNSPCEQSEQCSLRLDWLCVWNHISVINSNVSFGTVLDWNHYFMILYNTL
jgi:hypothetical protein